MWRVCSAVVFILLSTVVSAQELGVMAVDSYVAPKGAFINVVVPGGSAAAAGLVPGDVVTAVDGAAITRADELRAIIIKHKAGDKVALHVVHAGNKSANDVRLVLAGGGGSPASAVASATETTTGSGTATAISTKRAAASAPAIAAAPVAAAAARAQQTGRASDIRWVKYADPQEHAFALDVPAGWRVQGGSRRMSTVEIRVGVDMTSPDGAIHIFYGDVNVPIYTVPSQLLSAGGFGVGKVYSPGFGQQFVVMPYLNGAAFAGQWGAQRVARACGGVKRTSTQARPDASRGIDQAFAAGGIRTSIIAGEANFACSLQGAPAEGYVFAATELVRMQGSALWSVKSLAGFVANEARVAEANALLGHVVGSFAIDSGWASRQQQTTAQTSAVVAQSNRVVSNAIAERGRTLAATSDLIVKGGKARSDTTTNAIDRYNENAVRGTSTYTNPATGTSKTLDNSYAHQYINNRGETMGTNSETSPGAGWTEMRRVQPGK